MRSLYCFHEKEEYAQIKRAIFSFSVIQDAIRAVHLAIEDEVASYLGKVYSGEYKNVTFSDTDEAIVISLYTRAKSALLNRKVIGRKSVRTKVSNPVEDVINEFEKELRNPPESEQMKFPND